MKDAAVKRRLEDTLKWKNCTGKQQFQRFGIAISNMQLVGNFISATFTTLGFYSSQCNLTISETDSPRFQFFNRTKAIFHSNDSRNALTGEYFRDESPPVFQAIFVCLPHFCSGQLNWATSNCLCIFFLSRQFISSQTDDDFERKSDHTAVR